MFDVQWLKERWVRLGKVIARPEVPTIRAAFGRVAQSIERKGTSADACGDAHLQAWDDVNRLNAIPLAEGPLLRCDRHLSSSGDEAAGDAVNVRPTATIPPTYA
jgi:hypothetical protein